MWRIEHETEKDGAARFVLPVLVHYTRISVVEGGREGGSLR